MNVTLKNTKSRFTAPFQEAKDVRLFFDNGIDCFGGLLSLLEQIGRIETGGGGPGTYRIREPWAGGKDIKFEIFERTKRCSLSSFIGLSCVGRCD